MPWVQDLSSTLHKKWMDFSSRFAIHISSRFVIQFSSKTNCEHFIKIRHPNFLENELWIFHQDSSSNFHRKRIVNFSSRFVILISLKMNCGLFIKLHPFWVHPVFIYRPEAVRWGLWTNEELRSTTPPAAAGARGPANRSTSWRASSTRGLLSQQLRCAIALFPTTKSDHPRRFLRVSASWIDAWSEDRVQEEPIR